MASEIQTHIIVKCASGTVAGWNFPDLAAARKFADECNEAAPWNTASVVTWTDAEWLPLLATGAYENAVYRWADREHEPAGATFDFILAAELFKLHVSNVRLADVPVTLCGNCGCTFGQPYPRSAELCEPARLVTDTRTDALCSKCTASYTWLPADWYAANPDHYVRIPR